MSIFFIIVKAITLGNQKTTKWLITTIIAFLSENIMIAPIKVLKLSFIVFELFSFFFSNIDNNWFIHFKNLIM